MVGSDHDECLVGMLLIKFVSHSDSIVHIFYLFEDSGSVVGMAGPVYLASLNHEEESFVCSLGKEVDAGTGNVGKS